MLEAFLAKVNRFLLYARSASSNIDLVHARSGTGTNALFTEENPMPERPKTKPVAKSPEPIPTNTITPDRPFMGALIDPMGHAPQVLTEREYDALRSHLAIKRSDDHASLADFISSALFIFEKDPSASAEKALAWVVTMWMADHHDDSDGILIARLGQTVAVLENEGEYRVIRSILAVLRLGGWFAKWLTLQCEAISKASKTADRYPSPLTIMSTLTEALAEFEVIKPAA
jgi:hypothetical protein